MTRDTIAVALLAVAFATLVTTHVAIALGLARRPPRWRGLVALVIAPLAPWWGWHEKMHVRGVIWIVSAAAYVVGLVLAG